MTLPTHAAMTLSTQPALDELVEKDVGDGANQREAALILADDFVAGGEGDHLLHLQAEGDGCAVGTDREQRCDGFGHGEKLRYLSAPPRWLAFVVARH